MRCEYCGYIGEKEDFEEGKYGFWCPMCDGVLYKEGKESFSQTHVILEQSKLKNSTPVQKSKLKKRLSPLRYPGGKSKLIDQLLPYIQDKECFVEAFCGGSSLGLALLDAGKIHKLVLNDLDRNVYAFWKIVCSNQYKELNDKILEYSPIKETYFAYQERLKSSDLSDLDRAFYFLVINRCSFSGIQMANTKSDMKDRWIPKSLTERIKKIHSMSDYIEVRNNDAMELIEEMYWNPKNCIFIDPPYIEKGDQLYPVKFHLHQELAELITDLLREFPGCADLLLTYDDQEILHQLYNQNHIGIHIIGRNYSCRR